MNGLLEIQIFSFYLPEVCIHFITAISVSFFKVTSNLYMEMILHIDIDGNYYNKKQIIHIVARSQNQVTNKDYFTNVSDVQYLKIYSYETKICMYVH